MITRNRFSILSEQPDVGHYNDGQDQYFVVYDEITEVLQGGERERTAGGDDKRWGNQSVGNKQLRQCRKEDHRVL